MHQLSLGEKIKLLRKKNGLTQKQLADKIPVSFSTFRRWETGEHKPNIQFMKQLAEILHTSVAYLSGELDDASPIIGSSSTYFITPNEPIKETITTKITSVDEQKTANFTYWGNVLDETRNAIERGDYREISLIETLLNSACEMIADGKKRIAQMYHPDAKNDGARQHFDIHDNTMKAENISMGGTSSSVSM